MSWRAGQHLQDGKSRVSGQGRPLAAMTAAVLGAAQKPFVEQGLKELLRSMERVPGDIDWMAFSAGVQRYAAQEFVHSRPVYVAVATRGRVSLLDAGGEGAPVVVVPSMVNRGYVLDLYPGQSLVEYLRGLGLRVLLVDWGDPADGDAPMKLDDVITERLEPLVQEAVQKFGPVAMFGYCMGGLLALAAAVRLGPEVVNKLALAATPWDFQQTGSALHMQQGRPLVEPWVQGLQILPPEVMAHYFWLLDPWGPVRRVMAYGREQDVERVKFLTVLEDWLADGLGLDGPIAGEMLFEWYGDNRTLRGEWKVGGVAIKPGDLHVPLWVCITQRDVLVPTASSLPLIGQAKGAQVVMANTGHVGLVCGRKARSSFFEPLGGWLKS